MSVKIFKAKVHAAISEAALHYFSCEKDKLSKIRDIPHTELKLPNYLQAMALDVQDSRFIFKLRSRIIVKTYIEISTVILVVQFEN